ncbi:MAG: hypothetical protein KKG60_03465 [Nanoarchaeota archaeon]|nr:hypothetical protein [Nanoarchaeota archaeon]
MLPSVYSEIIGLKEGEKVRQELLKLLKKGYQRHKIWINRAIEIYRVHSSFLENVMASHEGDRNKLGFLIHPDGSRMKKELCDYIRGAVDTPQRIKKDSSHFSSLFICANHWKKSSFRRGNVAIISFDKDFSLLAEIAKTHRDNLSSIVGFPFDIKLESRRITKGFPILVYRVTLNYN